MGLSVVRFVHSVLLASFLVCIGSSTLLSFLMVFLRVAIGLEGMATESCLLVLVMFMCLPLGKPKRYGLNLSSDR